MIEAFAVAVALQHAAKIPEFPVPPVYQEYEACVAERESNNRPGAINPTGKYRGMYQFNDELADGTTFHILEWLGTWHSKPKKYASWLREVPMNKWPEEVHTAAFVAVLDGHDAHERWAGKFHFAGGRWHC